MASPYYNQLHLALTIEMVTYDPNESQIINVEGKDKIDTYESANVVSPYIHTVQLKKDDVDVEVIPASLSGVKFAHIRVKTENLATVPSDGSITAKITSAVGTDQLIKGDLIMIRDGAAAITSIKLTNNEDDSNGVVLPVLVILGGIKI